MRTQEQLNSEELQLPKRYLKKLKGDYPFKTLTPLMNIKREMKKLKLKWNWLYKNGKLDEKAVLKEIYDYDFILGEVPKVYCEITGGLLSKPNYASEVVLREFNERFWDKKIIISDIREMISSAKTLEELKEELKSYLD